MKRFFSLLIIFTIIFSTNIVFAEHTLINAKLRKEFRKDTVNVQMEEPSEKYNLIFENDQLKIEIENIKFGYYQFWGKGNIRKYFLSSHPDSVYHALKATLGETIDYITAIGIKMKFTNKTNEILYINLNDSVISLGSYIGRPVLTGSTSDSSISANTAPIIIPANGTIQNTLLRGDNKLINISPFDKAWVFPSDLSVENNIFGKGEFIFAVGKENQIFIPMNFNWKISDKYIDQYRQQHKYKNDPEAK